MFVQQCTIVSLYLHVRSIIFRETKGSELQSWHLIFKRGLLPKLSIYFCIKSKLKIGFEKINIHNIANIYLREKAYSGEPRFL